jgi:S-disulfanyl-L-cysteine oxidoreductase SoxD
MLTLRTIGPTIGLVPAMLFFPISWVAAQTGSSAGGGYYTTSQADAGKNVFQKTCAICHGEQLEGGAGPALAGKQFLSVSQFQDITADYFYHFMSTHMPLTNPGSLTKTQYLDVMAYFLQVNGYAAGSHPLMPDDKELKAIKIEPQH